MTQRRARRLFVDDFHISDVRGLRRTMNSPVKHPANPVLLPDKPWDGKGIGPGNAGLYDPKDGLIKIWYYANGRACYATSRDGQRWEKPELGLFEFEGSKSNNILPQAVFPLLAGDAFGPPAPRQRFVGVAWNAKLGQHVMFSDDGFQFTPGRSVVIDGVGDTFNPVKSTMPISGNSDDLPSWPNPGDWPRYLGTARLCMPVRGFDGSSKFRPTRRTQALTASNDIVNWREPIRILAPDEVDDQMARQRIEQGIVEGIIVHHHPDDCRCEFYTMRLIPYEDLYVGLLMVFDASYEFGRMGSNNQAGPMHTQLVCSRDLINWTRLGDRKPWLNRGGPDDHDCCGAYYCGTPILQDNTLHIYYSGSAITHAAGRDVQYMKGIDAKVAAGKLPSYGAIDLCTLRRDGWISLDAGNEPGFVLTKTLPWPASGQVHINVDAGSSGEAWAAVCHPDGIPVAGYEASNIVRGDHLDAMLLWTGKTCQTSGPLATHGAAAETGISHATAAKEIAPGAPVRLKITARNAKLYSYWN